MTTPRVSVRLSSLSALLLLSSQFAALPSAAAGELAYPFRLAEQQVAPGDSHLIASNAGWAPVQVTLQAANAASPDASTGTWTIVIPANSRTDLAARLPALRRQYGALRYQWSIGAPARQDPAAVYHLPFVSKQPVLVSQAFGGRETTHNTPQSRYAIDFSMPRGTPVLAARDGTVVLAVDSFGEGGPDAADLDRANMVEILHNDGTMAEYVHLLKDHVYVHPGQKVHAGQTIGLSGNSGFSSAPHLHFGVQEKVGTQNLSIPVTFASSTGQAFQPKYGELLVND